MPKRAERRKPTDNKLQIVGAKANNLQDLTVELPLGVFISVTGVSGAGKSTLINQILAPALSAKLNGKAMPLGEYQAVHGTEHIQKVIQVDQSPIGTSPRSNPATYSKALDHIRKLFAGSKEARLRGYKSNRFSFNNKGGRCEVCQGQGYRKVEMQFLSDVFVTCDVCEGKRFNEATLSITFREKSIADVLAMSVEEAYRFFQNHPKLRRILGVLRDVGLGYIGLGQPANTLSGGEAQRMKLARELSRPQKGHTLYILDEPTTGLHFDDVARLVQILHQLVDEDNTVLLVEHDLGVIESSDWVVDLGPDGGTHGGQLVGAGTPEHISTLADSHTGVALRAMKTA